VTTLPALSGSLGAVLVAFMKSKPDILASDPGQGQGTGASGGSKGRHALGHHFRAGEASRTQPTAAADSSYSGQHGRCTKKILSLRSSEFGYGRLRPAKRYTETTTHDRLLLCLREAIHGSPRVDAAA
jgi:hypothetical protein